MEFRDHFRKCRTFGLKQTFVSRSGHRSSPIAVPSPSARLILHPDSPHRNQYYEHQEGQTAAVEQQRNLRKGLTEALFNTLEEQSQHKGWLQRTGMHSARIVRFANSKPTGGGPPSAILDSVNAATLLISLYLVRTLWTFHRTRLCPTIYME